MLNIVKASIVINVKIQNRNGFYYATIFMLIISISILQFMDVTLKTRILPFMIVMNLISTTGVFLAINVLFDKQERSFYALLTSPLSNEIYIMTKMIPLLILSLIEGLGIYLFGFNRPMDFLYIILGIIILCSIYSLAGYATTLKYSNFNELIFPLIGFIMLLSGNLFFQLLEISSPFLLIFPVYGGFQLLSKPFNPSFSGIDLFIFFCQSIFWLVLIFIFMRRNFRKFLLKMEV